MLPGIRVLHGNHTVTLQSADEIRIYWFVGNYLEIPLFGSILPLSNSKIRWRIDAVQIERFHALANPPFPVINKFTGGDEDGGFGHAAKRIKLRWFYCRKIIAPTDVEVLVFFLHPAPLLFAKSVDLCSTHLTNETYPVKEGMN